MGPTNCFSVSAVHQHVVGMTTWSRQQEIVGTARQKQPLASIAVIMGRRDEGRGCLGTAYTGLVLTGIRTGLYEAAERNC